MIENQLGTVVSALQKSVEQHMATEEHLSIAMQPLAIVCSLSNLSVVVYQEIKTRNSSF
jgi:hypothetical protein